MSYHLVLLLQCRPPLQVSSNSQGGCPTTSLRLILYAVIAARPENQAQQQRLCRQLWDLAQHVGGYLRRHTSPAVRLATALLLAASLAACNASASDTTTVETRAVAPLAQEVVSGLPRGPGTFAVVPGSVFRDQRGVYQFEWLDPGQTAAPGHVAHVSRLRLVRDDRLALEMADGADPILHLLPGEDVGLIQEAQVSRAQPGITYYPPVYSYWSPFSPGVVIFPRPAYYDPPRTIVVPQAPDDTGRPVGTAGTGAGGSGAGTTRVAPRVEGGTVSEAARPPAQRVTGIQSAVSGRAGGTGAGSAVTSRNLSSGASGGTSGSAGAARLSGSSSGVSAPRSSGFSSGAGSAGGSAAS